MRESQNQKRDLENQVSSSPHFEDASMLLSESDYGNWSPDVKLRGVNKRNLKKMAKNDVFFDTLDAEDPDFQLSSIEEMSKGMKGTLSFGLNRHLSKRIKRNMIIEVLQKRAPESTKKQASANSRFIYGHNNIYKNFTREIKAHIKEEFLSFKSSVEDTLQREGHTVKALNDLRIFILVVCLLIFVSNEFEDVFKSKNNRENGDLKLDVRRLAFVLGCLICPKQMLSYVSKPFAYSPA